MGCASGAPPTREFDSLIVWELAEKEMDKCGGPEVPEAPQWSGSLIVKLAFDVRELDRLIVREGGLTRWGVGLLLPESLIVRYDSLIL